MKNNNEINNINENSFSDSKIKESTNSDTNKVLPIKSNETPWYKKKSSIIAMSSTLGAVVLTTAIAVPLAITSTQNTAELTKVVTVYDLTKKTAKLVVEGKNLPNDNTLYSVFRETKAKALTQIDTTITLNFISATEISLDFADTSVAANTIYQVKLNNGTTSGNTITSIPTKNIDQPSFTISAQPSDVALSTNSGTTLSATFTVTPSAVTNEISGQSLSYQWKTSDTNTTTDESKWTVIENETKATYTYDAKDLAINTKKYFKCIVSYKYANSVTSTIASVVITSQPTFTITQPTSQILTSASTSFTLDATANVIGAIGGQSATYQWQSSISEIGSYANIDGATNATYTKQLDSGTKNSLRDTWYKCVVTYTGAVTPTITSNPALVKMTLTAAEARAEFIKWSAIRTNYEPIIKEFFKGINTSGSSLHLYYTSLQDHLFKVGSEPKNVEIVSVVGETLPVTGDSNGLKTYKIRLKTLGESKYRSKTGSDTTTETTLPTGSFIEFYTLFSFQGNNIILRNTADSANYDMNLSLTFFENETTIRTTVEWTSTNPDNGPSDANPLKKGAYPVKIFGTDGTTEIFTDSLYLPIRPAATAFTTASTNPAIPAYHIRLTH